MTDEAASFDGAPGGTGEPHGEHDPKLERPIHHVGRRKLTFIVAPIAILWICNPIGFAIGPKLLPDPKPGGDPGNTLLLMALSPSNKNVTFAATAVQQYSQYTFALFLVVGTLRLLAPDASFYILGKLYGARALTWMENRTKTLGSSMRWLEQVFPKAGHALVLIMPNNPVCLLAGAAEMSFAVFALLNVIGTIGRMFLLYWVGEKLTDPITWLFQLVADYRPYFLATSIAFAVLLVLTEFRKGTTEVQALAELEDELEPEEEESV